MLAKRQRHVRLFRNGRNQALRIPREFELEGDEAIIRKDGPYLIVEPVMKKNIMLECLRTLEPIDEEIPEIYDAPVPNEEIL